MRMRMRASGTGRPGTAAGSAGRADAIAMGFDVFFDTKTWHNRFPGHPMPEEYWATGQIANALRIQRLTGSPDLLDLWADATQRRAQEPVSCPT